METIMWILATIACVIILYLLIIMCIQLTADAINNIKYSKIRKQIEELENKLSKR